MSLAPTAGRPVRLLLLAAFAVGCAQPAGPASPPPKRTQVLATEWDDRAAGAEAEDDVVAQLGLYRDSALEGYLGAVGQRVALHAPGRFEYRFRIVDPWTPNAFALPGGAIFVSRGLLALTSSEDELACVLGHEITHASARHSAAAQETEARLSPLSLGFVRAAYMAAYQRDEERAADAGGQALCAAAGYDPRALPDFLRRLGGVERLERGAQRIPGFFDTHPGTTERLAIADTRAAQLRYTAQPGVTGSATGHLQRLDGLVVDEDPADGIFRGMRFLHPDLDFGMSFPEGWTLVNTPAEVGAMSPKRDARIALQLDSEGNDPKAAADAFLAARAKEGPLEVTDARALSIGALPAYQVRGRASTPEGLLVGQITWIAHGGRIYRVSLAAPTIAAAGYEGRVQSATRSFRPLSGDERAAIEVSRLRIVRAGAGETLEALSERVANAWSLEETNVANGFVGSLRLTEGQPVKVANREPYTTAGVGERAVQPGAAIPTPPTIGR